MTIDRNAVVVELSKVEAEAIYQLLNIATENGWPDICDEFRTREGEEQVPVAVEAWKRIEEATSFSCGVPEVGDWS